MIRIEDVMPLLCSLRKSQIESAEAYRTHQPNAWDIYATRKRCEREADELIKEWEEIVNNGQQR